MAVCTAATASLCAKAATQYSLLPSGAVTSTMGIARRVFAIPRICPARRRFSSPELCHNQTDPIETARSPGLRESPVRVSGCGLSGAGQSWPAHGRLPLLARWRLKPAVPTKPFPWAAKSAGSESRLSKPQINNGVRSWQSSSTQFTAILSEAPCPECADSQPADGSRGRIFYGVSGTVPT
jgi:hypothetical protein